MSSMLPYLEPLIPPIALSGSVGCVLLLGYFIFSFIHPRLSKTKWRREYDDILAISRQLETFIDQWGAGSSTGFFSNVHNLSKRLSIEYRIECPEIRKDDAKCEKEWLNFLVRLAPLAATGDLCNARVLFTMMKKGE